MIVGNINDHVVHHVFEPLADVLGARVGVLPAAITWTETVEFAA